MIEQDFRPHPNDGAELTVRELRVAARATAEAQWLVGSPGGSDARHAARAFVDRAIEVAFRARALR